MYDPIKTIEYKNHKIKIYPDENPRDPRKEQDNQCIMLCSHRNYDLWDEKLYNYWSNRENDFAMYCQWKYNTWACLCDNGNSFEDEKEEEKCWKWINDNIVRENLYLYDHSGITISTSRFSCQRDSWQVGFIYILKSEILENRSDLKDDTEIMKKGYEIIKAEVREYDNYLTWNVYGYNIEGKRCDDSCRGFSWDDEEYMIDQAKAEIDACINKYTEDHLKKVKAYITNKVPLENREAYSV